MGEIKNIFRRVNYRFRHDFFTIENVVLILAIFLCLIWTYQSIVAMSRNWELSERLTTERKNLELVTVEVEMAELENEYYKSNEFQELMARRDLDKKLEGENMVVMPENSSEARNKYKASLTEKEEIGRSNFEKWMLYLLPNF